MSRSIVPRTRRARHVPRHSTAPNSLRYIIAIHSSNASLQRTIISRLSFATVARYSHIEQSILSPIIGTSRPERNSYAWKKGWKLCTIKPEYIVANNVWLVQIIFHAFRVEIALKFVVYTVYYTQAWHGVKQRSATWTCRPLQQFPQVGLRTSV